MSVLLFSALTLLVLSHIHAMQYLAVYEGLVMSDRDVIASFNKPKGMIGEPFANEPVLNPIHTYKTLKVKTPFADWKGINATVGTTNAKAWAHYLSKDVYNDEFIQEYQSTDWYKEPEIEQKKKIKPLNLIPFWILLALVVSLALYRFVKIKSK